ncbi:Dexamethasone-induced Ras protein 1 [Fasciolopsis buskii]|uniref:Dexamethasone-induced Ras protein 1 n=1 Tax=Fasciolopsis buskii TaxID=27845 RepID=A0A8E0RQK0_9TREM|nr:Dexamethasone-induced Ras protein 1 [Fasciolopsis buski]
MTTVRTKYARPSPISIAKQTDVDYPDESPALSPSAQSVTSSSSGSMTMSTKRDEVVRIVFLGSARVGKSSIINRFLHNRFETKYIPTVEDMHSKKYIVRDHLVSLSLVDTAGSFDFPAMLRLCIAKASAFVIVFSHDNADSLIQAGILLNQIKSQRKDYAPMSNVLPVHEFERLNLSACGTDQSSQAAYMNPASPPITVVCNKSDLPPSDSQVSESAIMEWLLTHGLKPSQFVYASAKTNEAILSIFKSLWSQNEATKSIQLERWDRSRRSSIVRPPTPPLGLQTDFSALHDVMSSSGNSAAHQHGDSPTYDKSDQRTRAGFFRSSLRLSRRSSSKSNKQKSDIVKLECVLS